MRAAHTTDGQLRRQQMRIVFLGAGRTRAGQPSWVLGLGNSSDHLEGDLPLEEGSCSGLPLGYGDVVEVTARCEQVNTTRVPATPRWLLEHVRLLAPDDIGFETLLPRLWVAASQQPALTLLIQHLNDLKCRDLRRFVVDILLNANTALGLLIAPASTKHHHAFPGGLLEHTVDMLTDFAQEASAANTAPEFKDLMRVLILVHDIGKIVTHAGNGYTERGHWQAHETAGLELMASPLATLERNQRLMAHLIRSSFRSGHYQPGKPHALHQWLSRLDSQSARRIPAFVHTLKENYHALSRNP